VTEGPAAARSGGPPTDEEFIAAFSIILPPDEARDEGLAWNAFPDPEGFEDATPEDLRESEFSGPRSYDGDLLDLLSLVSDDCAARAWRLLRISNEEGERRRGEFRRKIDEALRAQDG
jgi:hypothetical protein